MAILDFFRRTKEKERFLRKRKFREQQPASDRLADFSSEKKDTEKNEVSDRGQIYRILKSPHITEKSTFLNERGVYVFKVKPRSNKITIKNAIEKLYGVSVNKVRVIPTPSKEKFIRGKWGRKPGYKKAVVYLQKGEKIEF